MPSPEGSIGDELRRRIDPRSSSGRHSWRMRALSKRRPFSARGSVVRSTGSIGPRGLRIACRLVVVVALVVGCGSVAQADMVETPRACPPGSVGTSDHGGVYCTALECSSSAACVSHPLRRVEEGATCELISFCVEEVTVVAPSLRRRTRDRTLFRGPCRPDGSCDHGACVTERACIRTPIPEALAPRTLPPSGAPPPQAVPTKRIGGCTSTGPAPSNAGVALVLAGVALTFFRRCVRRP